MTVASLPHAAAPFIVFTDFDGTITTRDSNDAATEDLGFGLERRLEINADILNGRATFKDGFREMLASISANGHSFEDTKEYLTKTIKLDPGFKVFLEWCQAHDVPVIIVSSGMTPIIRSIMENLVGKAHSDSIEIIANEVEYLPGGLWNVKFRHPETGFGHDKSRSTGPYRDLAHKPTLFFCGDGVSDLSAARAADLLFVKVVPNHTNDLFVHCQREAIPFVSFEQFLQVRDAVAAVVSGTKTVQETLDGQK